MLITFTLELEAYKKFNKFALKQASGNKNEKKSFLVNFIVWLLVAIVFMFIFQAMGNKRFNFDYTTAFIVLLPVTVGVVIYFYEMRKLQRNVLPENDGFLFSESTVEINEEGLKATKSNAQSFFSWNSIVSVRENEGDFYLFLDNMYAIIIPSSAFSGIEQADEFRGMINKYL